MQYLQLLFSSVLLFISIAAPAQEVVAQKAPDYLARLKAASTLLSKPDSDVDSDEPQSKPSLHLSGADNSSALAALGLRRFYRVGDTWEVAFYPVTHPETRKSATLAAAAYSAPVRYRFEVSHIDRYEDRGRARKLAVIRVDPLDPLLVSALAERKSPVSLNLVINDLFHGLEKHYVYADGTMRSVSLDARRNLSAGFDRFPVDLPNVSRTKAAESAGSGATAIPFAYTNAYGKQVTAKWSRGSLWPDEVVTAAGLSRLVAQAKGGSR